MSDCEHEFPCKGGKHQLVYCPKCGDVYCKQCGATWFEAGPPDEPARIVS